MAQLDDLAQAARLEHLEYYRCRQEAAKGFDDDLEFCPSLSAEELAEFRQKASQRIMKPNVTPPQPKRAIPIIDPANKTPLNITPVRSTSNTSSPTPSNNAISPQFFPRSGSPFYGRFSPPTFAYGIATKATKSIPIVDPTSGHVLNMPNGPSSNASNNGSTGFSGYYSDISVR